MASWLASRRYRGPLASFLLFAGTLFPVLGFLNVYPFRYAWVADHFQYLASLGIIVPLAALLTTVAGRMARDKKVTIALSAVLVLVLGVLTWRQSRMYRDMETLYRETLARNPESYLAHNNLGGVLLDRGDLKDAMPEFETAMRIEPDYPEAHYNRGTVLSRTPGHLDDAMAEYRNALRIKPDYPEARDNLGSALMRMGRLQDAIAEFRIAVRTKPDDTEAHNDLGTALSHVPGRLPDAIAEYQAALRIDPDNAEAHYNLGLMLAKTPAGFRKPSRSTRRHSS